MTTPTQGEHAQTALAHAAGLESFSKSLPAYGFNPQPLKDAAATIRRLHAQVAALTAGNREELAHELFAAAQLAPGEGIEDAVSRIAAALTAAPVGHVVLPVEAVNLAIEALDWMPTSDATMHLWERQQPALQALKSAPAQPAAPQGVADWTQPTTVAQRLGDAVQLLCGGKRPPDAMVTGWLDNTSEELQSFAASNGPAWAQGIGLIDAAMVMVDQPTEITTIDHPDRTHALRASNGQAPAGAADNQRELLEDAAFLLRKYRRLCVEIGRGDSQHLDRIEAAAVAVRALYAEPTSTAQVAPAAGAVAGPAKQCAGIPRPGCDYMAECGSVCRKCGKVHSAHLLMFDTPQPRWASYEVAVSDPVFQVARSIMGTENLGQDRQLVAAINHVLAAAPTPDAQADSQPAQCHYSIDADPQGIRAMVADAITGALAFGAQGANPPPAGHWLAPFWNAARADHSQADSQPASPTDYPTLPEPSATGLGDEYEAYDRTGRAMGKAYETILYFKADQMRAYVDADREARKQGGV